MVEAVMLWNEPNNLSHWDFKIDPDWKMFAEMASRRPAPCGPSNPELKIVLGGISPIDPHFHRIAGFARRAGRDRCGGGARISVGLESLEDRRLAAEDRRNPRRHAQAGLGFGGRSLFLRSRRSSGRSA